MAVSQEKGTLVVRKRAEKRSYKDRREYLIAVVRKRRKMIRGMAIKYKGGCCQVCGYNRCQEALELHHLDSSQKEFNISQYGHSRSWERVKRELDKCVLVCANCHRELHVKSQLPRETVVEKVGFFREALSEVVPERRVILSEAPTSNI